MWGVRQSPEYAGGVYLRTHQIAYSSVFKTSIITIKYARVDAGFACRPIVGRIYSILVISLRFKCCPGSNTKGFRFNTSKGAVQRHDTAGLMRGTVTSGGDSGEVLFDWALAAKDLAAAIE